MWVCFVEFFIFFKLLILQHESRNMFLLLVTRIRGRETDKKELCNRQLQRKNSSGGDKIACLIIQ
jgi:hypothetical protein